MMLRSASSMLRPSRRATPRSSRPDGRLGRGGTVALEATDLNKKKIIKKIERKGGFSGSGSRNHASAAFEIFFNKM
jgi:hypothetical protein